MRLIDDYLFLKIVESDYKIIHEGYKNNKFEELNARLTEVFNLFK